MTALDVVLQLSLARTLVVRDMERSLTSHGIGLSDFALLTLLAHAPHGQMQRGELAEQLGVTTSGIARQLQPLERIGLVDRISDPKDARKAHVVITKAGSRTVSEVTEDAEEAASRSLEKRWSATEQKTLRALLGRIATS